MSSLKPKDRVSLCRYTYADHRKCLTPRSPAHRHFCYFHARRESQSVAADKLAADLAYFFSGQYISANDLCYAMGRLIPAVVRGDIKPRTASTLAYLAQTFIQAIQVAQKEYIYAFGTPEWGTEIRNNVSGNLNRVNESDTPDTESETDTPDPNEQSSAKPNPDQVAPHDPNSCSGGSSDPCGSESEEQEENDELLEPTEASAHSFSAPPKTCHPERSEGSVVSSYRQATRPQRAAAVLPSKPTDTSTPLEATLMKN